MQKWSLRLRVRRIQIRIDGKQRRKLERIARQEGRCIADVTRRVLDTGLKVYASEGDLMKKRRQVLPLLKILRQNQPEGLVNGLTNGDGDQPDHFSGSK